MSDYLLDSGILIRHLRNYANYPELLDHLSDKNFLFISTITRFEVIQGLKERERKLTYNVLSSVENIPVSEEVANLAGELVLTWKSRGITLGIADVLIAATAIHHELTLVTTNGKHFPMPELSIVHADEQGNLTTP